jgi:hypothetical protein
MTNYYKVLVRHLQEHLLKDFQQILKGIYQGDSVTPYNSYRLHLSDIPGRLDGRAAGLPARMGIFAANISR